MSATTAHYHVAIVGTDLAGLILGAMCSKLGYRVIVLGHGSRPTMYRQGAHWLCRRPQLFYGMGSPPVRHVFEQLGLGLELRNLPRREDPGFQVVLPRARLDVTTDPDRMRSELAREFPGQEDKISSFYRRVREVDAQVEEVLSLGNRLPPQGLIETFQFRRLVKRFPFLDDEWALEDPLAQFPHGDPFRAFALAPLRFCVGMTPAKPYPATLVRCLNELRKGTFEFTAGPDALRELFMGIIRGAGDVRDDERATAIELRRGRATHVQLAARRNVVGCDVLVCNTEPKRFFALIPAESQREEYHHAIHTLQPVFYTFTANFVVSAEAIPEAMARHVFAVFDPRRPLEEDNCVHILRDPTPVRGDPAERVITASMRVPISAATSGRRVLVGMLDTLQTRVESVVPFLSEHLVSRHCTWFDDSDADAGPTNETVAANELFPSYGEAIAHTLGTSPVGTTTGYKNILLGSDAAFGGLGSDGPYTAALHLMALVRELVSVKSGF